MTREEFTERTGLTPTHEEYAHIEAMYMAAGSMDKDTFCRDYKKYAGSMILAEFFKQIKTLTGQLEGRNKELEDCHSDNRNLAHFLIGKACVYSDSDFYKKAVKLIGQREVVIYKVQSDLPLWDEDRDYIATNIL